MRSLFAFLGGAVIGAAVAILLAPEKGSVTREKIKDFVDCEQDKLCRNVKSEAAKVRTKARKVVAKVRQAAEELASEEL